MKAIVLKYIASCMAILVLFSSSGLGMYKHSCSMANHETLSFQEKDACCKLEIKHSDAKVQLKQAACCHTEKVLAKTTLKNQFKNENFKAKSQIFAQHHFIVFAENHAFFKRFTKVFQFVFDPPPLSTSHFLALIQLYQI